MTRFQKWFAFFLLAALFGPSAAPARAHDTEPIRIYADQETALVNPLLMIQELYENEALMDLWGDMQLFAESPEETLIVYASKRGDGGLAILVINEDTENAHAAEIHLEGFREGGPAVPYRVMSGSIEKEDITVPLFDGKFGYEFAPVSATLFVVPSQQSMVIPLAVGTVAIAGAAAGVMAFRRRRR